ncbi:hypothetical protein FOCC_FOCC017222 [Frankliniella occidentalis]|nr:hypothetical protein FOCC_FOCC017222 [Frankliniella occidentalis]
MASSLDKKFVHISLLQASWQRLFFCLPDARLSCSKSHCMVSLHRFTLHAIITTVNTMCFVGLLFFSSPPSKLCDTHYRHTTRSLCAVRVQIARTKADRRTFRFQNRCFAAVVVCHCLSSFYSLRASFFKAITLRQCTFGHTFPHFHQVENNGLQTG